MNEEPIWSEIDYLGSLDEYLEFIAEHFGLESSEILLELEEKLEKIEPITWEEVLAQDGMDGVWEEDLAKKRRPQGHPKGTFHLDTHFRGASAHRDLRIKVNDHLRGWTITDQVEGAIKERVDSLAKARQYKWNNSKIFKFQPDMGDKNVKTVAIPKSDQPSVWLNVRNVVFPAGSVGATRFEKGVFLSVDEGMAYQGVQKPYFKEWFLRGRHFKGRFVVRLIPVRPGWEKKPKSKLQFQCWMTASTAKGQLPYLLSPRGRSRKDVAPSEGESWLPPEWEAKIKSEFHWWPNSKSKQAKIKLIDEAYNDLIERGEIKARKLKLWQEGGIVKDGLIKVSHGQYMPKELYDKLRNSQDVLSKWVLGSPYALPDDAPEEVKQWAAEMRKGLMREKPELQIDLNKRGFEDFEYLLHHVHISEGGKEEIHHCFLYDHIANLFEQAHLAVKKGVTYLEGKKIQDGIFHVIKGLESTQEITWSDDEAKKNRIKPKVMKPGMGFKEKSKEW